MCCFICNSYIEFNRISGSFPDSLGNLSSALELYVVQPFSFFVAIDLVCARLQLFTCELSHGSDSREHWQLDEAATVVLVQQ